MRDPSHSDRTACSMYRIRETTASSSSRMTGNTCAEWSRRNRTWPFPPTARGRFGQPRLPLRHGYDERPNPEICYELRRSVPHFSNVDLFRTCPFVRPPLLSPFSVPHDLWPCSKFQLNLGLATLHNDCCRLGTLIQEVHI
jgi:hypothetical protein